MAPAGLGPGDAPPAGRAGAGSWPRSPGIFTLLFTTFLTHPGGLWDGVYTGLEYWLGQHDVARGGEPAEFYTDVLVTIEWPVLIFGAIGAVSLWRRWPIFAAFLVWDFFVSLAVYSWAGEKFAWLVLHPLLPAILLAGAGIAGDLADARRAALGRASPASAVGAVLRRPLVVVGQRRPRRRPARDARLHAVLDAGQGGRRPGARAGRRAAARARRR